MAEDIRMPTNRFILVRFLCLREENKLLSSKGAVHKQRHTFRGGGGGKLCDGRRRWGGGGLENWTSQKVKKRGELRKK